MTSSAAKVSDAAVAAVERADDARIAAVIAGDVDALTRLLTDDLVYVHASGATQTRSELIDFLTRRTRYGTLKRERASTRVVGDLAIMHGLCSTSFLLDGTPREASFLFMSVWVPTDRGWRMTAWQSTKAPEPKA